MSALTILHVANFAFMPRHRPKGAAFHGMAFKLSHGLTRLGHHVFDFCDRSVARAATPFLSPKMGRRGVNRRLLDYARWLRPDMILFGHTDLMEGDTFTALRGVCPGVILAQWNVDPLFEADNVVRLERRRPFMDMTFVTSGPDAIGQYLPPGQPVAFLPNAVDPALEPGRAFDLDTPEADLFLGVGNDRLVRVHGGVETCAATLIPRLEAAVPGLRGRYPGMSGHPFLTGAAYTEALSTTALGLNLSRRNDVSLYSSDRLAHMIGNGQTILMDAANGYQAFFDETEIAYYRTEDELFAWVRTLMADPDRRRDMGRRGWAHYYRLFRCDHVARYLLAAATGTHDPATFDWETKAFLS